MTLPTPKELLAAAIVGFEHQKAAIESKIAELRAFLSDGSRATSTLEAAPHKRRKFSAATRRKMKVAQQARWAKIHGASKQPAPAPAPKAKRKLSAAARAKLAANLKKARAAKAAKAKAAGK